MRVFKMYSINNFIYLFKAKTTTIQKRIIYFLTQRIIHDDKQG